MIQATYWSLPSLAAMLLTVHAARRVRHSAGVPGATALLALCGSVFLWALGQFLGTLTTDLELKILASRLQYPGIALMPVTWPVFALTYARRVQRFSLPSLGLLLAVPAVTVGLAWTHGLHTLLWRSARLVAADGFVGLALDYGPWFYVHVAYSYALVAVGTVMLAYELSASPRHRRALVAVIAAPLVVAAMNVLHLSGLNPLPFIDPTPFGFALGTVMLAHGVLHSGLLDLSPTLHRQLLEQIDDAVIVLDAQGRMIDVNAAARRLLVPDGDPDTVLGAPIDAFLPNQPLARLAGSAERSLEIDVDLNTYHVRATRLNGEHAATTVLVFRDITQRLQAEMALRQVKQEMERLAFTDSLTGLHNRRAFTRRLQEECERVRRHPQSLSVVLLDLDRFKSVNDRFGHDAGDQALRRVAGLIADHSRSCDIAARLGGEEFALLLPGTALDGALRLAERLRQAVAATAVDLGDTVMVRVSVSAGVATADAGDADWQSLLRRADEALYRAKHEGRNVVRAGAPPDDPPEALRPGAAPP